MIGRLLAGLVLLWALGFALFAMTLPGPAGGQATDAIIVLTGGPGRLRRGLDLLEAGRARRLLVSGVDRRVRKRELAAHYGGPARLFDRVDLGDESVDTRSNAQESAAWLARRRYRSVRLVTTDWHMPRAHFELRRTVDDGVTILPDAIPSEPGLPTLLREYHKYLIGRATALAGW